jgi:Kef-type K+ transport system membrane component KefB
MHLILGYASSHWLYNVGLQGALTHSAFSSLLTGHASAAASSAGTCVQLGLIHGMKQWPGGVGLSATVFMDALLPMMLLQGRP